MSAMLDKKSHKKDLMAEEDLDLLDLDVKEIMDLYKEEGILQKTQ